MCRNANLTKISPVIDLQSFVAYRDRKLFKIFNLGLLLGIVGAGLLVWYFPAVDQFREGSLIVVEPNRGNSEVFRINLPRDRILAGVQGAAEDVPTGLEWPQHPMFANSQTELFKVRNREDRVVGVAGRIASSAGNSDPFIHWMLHLPARGTMFLDMGLAPTADGYRAGTLHAGTREFLELNGTVEERFISNVEEAEFDIDARIELTTAFVGLLGEEE